MAVRNHALDQMIIDAARAEFLEKGYRDASLHKIAARAGLTTGALYTRYKNKDALFCSLVQEVMDVVHAHSKEIQELYMKAQASGDLAEILAAIRSEEDIYQELLLEHKDACVLFFCRSEGSSLETMLDTMLEQKGTQTVEYLRRIAKTELDLDGVGMLLASQFLFFRKILERGYSPEKALSCMKTVELYMDAGWKAIFEAIL